MPGWNSLLWSIKETSKQLLLSKTFDHMIIDFGFSWLFLYCLKNLKSYLFKKHQCQALWKFHWKQIKLLSLPEVKQGLCWACLSWKWDAGGSKDRIRSHCTVCSEVWLKSRRSHVWNCLKWHLLISWYSQGSSDRACREWQLWQEQQWLAKQIWADMAWLVTEGTLQCDGEMLASSHWLSPSVSKTFSEICSSEPKPPASHPKRGTAPSAGLVLAMSQKPGWETEPTSAGPGGRAARGHL